MARAIRNAIRVNRLARIIRNWNPNFYSASGRIAWITRISDSRKSPDSRKSCESIRARHATISSRAFLEQLSELHSRPNSCENPNLEAFSERLSEGLLERVGSPNSRSVFLKIVVVPVPQISGEGKPINSKHRCGHVCKFSWQKKLELCLKSYLTLLLQNCEKSAGDELLCNWTELKNFQRRFEAFFELFVSHFVLLFVLKKLFRAISLKFRSAWCCAGGCRTGLSEQGYSSFVVRAWCTLRSCILVAWYSGWMLS